MKQLENIFRTLLCTVIYMSVAFLIPAKATAQESMDSVEIGLITCSPHEEIYSLYGHSALRYHDLRTGLDIAFNYGVFDYKAPHFVLRFVLGLTDYELGIFPFKQFCAYYQQWGSEMTEQVLNLTNKEKQHIAHALAENLKPENKVYRYNFFYDNCSTRPCDIVAQNLEGKLVFSPREEYEPSFRMMIHDHTINHPWASMGNDLLLGVTADMKTSQREQHFLPENLMYDFDHAKIIGIEGERQLVKERRTIIPKGMQIIEEDFPLTPTHFFVCILILFMVIFALEWRRRRCTVWLDSIFMLLMGLAGSLILFMFFSQHPTTSTNLQVLLLNPIHLFFLSSVLRRRETYYWKLLPFMVLLFLIGSIWQDYAEGMEILALCLLTRFWSHIRNDK